MNEERPGASRRRWAEFRLGVIGILLSAPPKRGDLGRALQALARCTWVHPINGKPARFHASTIARWYYAALHRPDEVTDALRPRVRRDRGQHRPRFADEAWATLANQYEQHPTWTYQLHAANLRALCEMDASLGPAPSYATVRRHMLQQGWLPKRSEPGAGRQATDTEWARGEPRRDEPCARALATRPSQGPFL